MADQTLDPRLESLLRNSLKAEAASLPLMVGLEQILERGRARNRGRLGLGLQLPRLIAAAGTAVVIVVAVVALGMYLNRPGIGVNPSPSPSPSGSPIADLKPLAYGVDGDVFLADADGSNPVLIADGEAVDFGYPECAPGDVRARYVVNGTAWAPDGRNLAYWLWGCPERPGGTVYVSDANGNVITSFPGQGWAISWSPDSTRVAVLETWMIADGQGGTILVYGLDGTRQAALTVPSAMWPPSGDFSPAWSRDGSSILLPGVRVRLDGGDIQPSDESGFYTGCCAYSPDGSLHGAVKDGVLTLEVADKPDSQKVGPTEFWSLAWSPDGKLVAYERFTDILQGDPTELLVRDVATGADTSLFDVPESDSLHVLEFTANGERILFTWRNGDQTSLWSIGADGSDARRLIDRVDWADLRPLGRL